MSNFPEAWKVASDGARLRLVIAALVARLGGQVEIPFAEAAPLQEKDLFIGSSADGNVVHIAVVDKVPAEPAPFDPTLN